MLISLRYFVMLGLGILYVWFEFLMLDRRLIIKSYLFFWNNGGYDLMEVRI